MVSRPIEIKKIDELPAAGAVSGTDKLVIMQGDDTVQTTVTDVTALVDLSAYVPYANATQITPNLGTAAAPIYSFAGDTNTGIWRPAADTVAVSTNGVERWRVDSTGKLVAATGTVNVGFNASQTGTASIVMGSGVTSTPSVDLTLGSNVIFGITSTATGGMLGFGITAGASVFGDNNTSIGGWAAIFGSYNSVTTNADRFYGGGAFGNYNTISSNGYAVGGNNIVTNSGLVFGGNSTISGTEAVGIGSLVVIGNQAIGISHMGGGTSGARVEGANSIGIGSFITTTPDATQGVGIGYAINVGGPQSLALGNAISSWGASSVNLGTNTTALFISPQGVSVNNQNPLSSFHATGALLVTDVNSGLGAELVGNGNFSGGTASWTGFGASGWVVSGIPDAYHQEDGTGSISQSFTTVIGDYYYATFTLSQYQSGTMTVQVAGVTLPLIYADNSGFGALRAYRAIVKATSTTQGISFTCSNTARMYGLDNISVKRISDGNLELLGGIKIREGAANSSSGVATLVAGTVTVNTTRVAANSRIQLTGNVDGGTVGFQRVSARVAGTSFTITSSSALDTSQIAWTIINPLV